MYNKQTTKVQMKRFQEVFSDQITIKRISLGIVGFFIAIVLVMSLFLVLVDNKDKSADAVEVAVPVSVSGYKVKNVNGVEVNSYKKINDPSNLTNTNLHNGDKVEIENLDNSKSSWRTLKATVQNNALTASIQKNEVCYWECTPASANCYYADSRNPDGSYWAFQLCAHTSSGDAIGRAECQERGHDLCGPGCYDFMGFRDYCCVPGDSGCFNLKLQCVVTWTGYWVEADGIGYHHWSVTNDGYKLRAEYQRWLGEFKAPATGTAQMQKKSSWDWTEPSPTYSLADARYYVYKTYDDALNRLNAVDVITLDETGFGESKNILYAELTYYVRESNLPLEHGYGYLVNEEIGSVKIQPGIPTSVTWSGGSFITYDVPIVQTLPLKLVKKDAQTNQEGVSEGSVPSFQDAYYNFEYRREFFRNFSELKNASLDKVWNWTIATDENGAVAVSEEYRDKKVEGDNFIEWNDRVVAPIGTYLITEVKAPDGYLINETKYIAIVEHSDNVPGCVRTTFYNFTNGEELEEILDPHTGDKAVSTSEQVVRGDYKFTKVNEARETLPGIPFKITSKTTGEWHIVVTDQNGLIDTSNSHYKHSQNTNCNDSLYDVETGKITKEESLTSNCGTWFGINKETGTLSLPDDAYCALPYDTYLIEEIPISLNEKYLPFESRTFVIENDTYNIAGDTWVNAEPKSPLPQTGDLPFCIIGLSVLAVLCYITRRWVYYRKY